LAIRAFSQSNGTMFTNIQSQFSSANYILPTTGESRSP
jgi:hypothetical protein